MRLSHCRRLVVFGWLVAMPTRAPEAPNPIQEIEALLRDGKWEEAFGGSRGPHRCADSG